MPTAYTLEWRKFKSQRYRGVLKFWSNQDLCQRQEQNHSACEEGPANRFSTTGSLIFRKCNFSVSKFSANNYGTCRNRKQQISVGLFRLEHRPLNLHIVEKYLATPRPTLRPKFGPEIRNELTTVILVIAICWMVSTTSHYELLSFTAETITTMDQWKRRCVYNSVPFPIGPIHDVHGFQYQMQ